MQCTSLYASKGNPAAPGQDCRLHTCLQGDMGTLPHFARTAPRHLERQFLALRLLRKMIGTQGNDPHRCCTLPKRIGWRKTQLSFSLYS